MFYFCSWTFFFFTLINFIFIRHPNSTTFRLRWTLQNKGRTEFGLPRQEREISIFRTTSMRTFVHPITHECLYLSFAYHTRIKITLWRSPFLFMVIFIESAWLCRFFCCCFGSWSIIIPVLRWCVFYSSEASVSRHRHHHCEQPFALLIVVFCYCP